MQKNSHFNQANCPRHFFLCLSLLLSVISLLTGFSSNAFGQVAIPLSDLNPELVRDLNAELQSGGLDHINIERVGKSLFVGSHKQLWIVSKNGQQSQEIKDLTESISGFQNVSDYLFINCFHGLWNVSSDGKQINKIKGIETVNSMRAVGDQLLVQQGKDLWLISKDGTKVKKVENISVAGFVTQIFAVGEKLFVGTTNLWGPQKDDGQLWIISRDGSKSRKIEDINGGVNRLISIGEQVFIATNKGLWIINKDTDQINKVENVQKRVRWMEKIGDQLFIIQDEELWIVSEDGKQFSKVESLKNKVFNIIAVNEQAFVATDNGLWILSKDGKQSKKIENIDGSIFYMNVVGEQIFVRSNRETLWIVSKDGERGFRLENIAGESADIVAVDEYIYINSFEKLKSSKGTLYRIDPNVSVMAKPVLNGWWAKFIDNFLPFNWLPTNNVGFEAFYNENGKDPYDKSFPKKFTIAKVKADNEFRPFGVEFTDQGQFSDEVIWGWHEYQYWIKDNWGNTFKTQKLMYYGVPGQYFITILPFILSAFLILGCFALAPKVGFCHSAIMNPWLRKYFSLGSVPLLVSVFPSLRRYILRRYSGSISKDKEFTEWKTRFVSPNEEFLPENFGKKLNDERRLLLTGQSGIGKTSFFKYLTAVYVSENKPLLPTKVFPVYISLTNYGGNSLEELVYTQLFAYGKITDKEIQPMFLEQGGLLIFFDGVNEIQNVGDRQKLGEFVEKYWTSNYICLSSQQSYAEIENLPKVELKTFNAGKVGEFIRNRVVDKEKAEKVIESLTNEDYQLYSVPRDLEFAVGILNGGKESLPKSRTELYKTVFSSIFAKWQENGRSDAENNLCEHAYRMIVERQLAFDSVDNPAFKEITADLFEQRFLIKREKNYNFRHDLIRAFLASEYFYPRWENLFAELDGKKIDSNWLEMLKFSCENIEDSGEVKNLVYEVLSKSIRKDLVKDLVRWLKANHPNKCRVWEKEFYAKYGELDFKIEDDKKVKKILFVSANPLQTTQLRLDEEFREVGECLRLSNGREQFELEISTATRPSDLRREMLRYEPQFVHFSGHGETEGIVLENEQGSPQIVETESLAELFSLFSDFTECVVLNSCYSENQAKAIRKYIPFVVGMNKAVPDIAAIQFAVGFYDAIGAGRNVEAAFKFGMNALDLNNIEGDDIPVLLKKRLKKV